MGKPDVENFGHFAISSNQLAKISFGLTTDQVNDLTMSLTHAEATVDLVRWYADARESMNKELHVVRPDGANVMQEPTDLIAGAVTTLLHRAVSDIGTARKLIENAARIKATRHGDEAEE